VFHLGWFFNFSAPLYWKDMWAGKAATEWTMPDVYVDLARSAERAGFDFLLLEDSSQITNTYGGTMEYVLKNAHAEPKQDPVPFVPLLAAATSRIGIIPTISASFYPPYLAARLGATLDHITNGRVGMNVVTSSTHLAAQNYGRDQHIEHDLRYQMAHEWVEVVTQLWESWEPDAVLGDVAAGVYADHTKVHTIDYQGRFFKSRGPLNTIPGPQRRPVLCQAGGSPAGRDLAARYAEAVVSGVVDVGAMKDYRRDMDERLIAKGRRPQDCKVLYLVSPILGDTIEEAREKKRRKEGASEDSMHATLAMMSYETGVDFAKFDLDAPLPEVTTNGHQSTLADFMKMAEGKTLREAGSTFKIVESMELVGTPDSVAAQMGEAMEEAGGDGFLITGSVARKYVSEITDGLATALRRRGLIRDHYAHELFRDNLLDF
jgi:FMN-dependent oxidoreductase (nitrilotriacetate monooxygenase family)